MERRVFVVGLGVAAVWMGVAFGQQNNARIDAMGGCNVVHDITNVFYYPAYVNDYRDVIQATLNPAVGPIIGVKALGDVFSVGLWYDQQRVLDDRVYTYLVGTVLNSLTGNGVLDAVADVSPIPHFLLGGDFNAVKVAADLFYERAFYSSYLLDDVAGARTESNLKAQFHNIGMKVGFNLNPDIFGLNVALGGSLPFIAGEYESTTAAGVATQEAKNEMAVAGNFAAETRFDVSDYTFTTGVEGEVVTYQGKIIDEPVGGPSTTVMNTKNLLLGVDGYGGVQYLFPNINILIVAQGLCGIYSISEEPDNIDATNYDPGKVTSNFVYYSVNAGLEKVWKEMKLLDLLQARCGLGYVGSITINREKGEAAGNFHEMRERLLTTRSGFVAIFGGGAGKGICQFDVLVTANALVNVFKLGNGTLTGNDFAKVTLTLDFGKIR